MAQYKIIQVHCKYNDAGQLELMAVLWESGQGGWMRATYCINRPIGGYKFLAPYDKISEELIQKVAGYGLNVPDNLKSKFFHGNINWEQ